MEAAGVETTQDSAKTNITKQERVNETVQHTLRFFLDSSIYQYWQLRHNKILTPY